MKELYGQAAAEVPAPPERCADLLADVERYPEWYPDVVRRVVMSQPAKGGAGAQARTTLRVPGIPVLGEVSFTLAVQRDGDERVTLTRIGHGPDDHERFAVGWSVTPTPSGSRIEAALEAELSVPRLVPLGGVGQRVADGFVAAAARVLTRPV